MTHDETEDLAPETEGEEDEADHEVPADLLELHEALEFQDAVDSQGASQ